MVTLRYAVDKLVADLPTLEREAAYQCGVAERNLQTALATKEAADAHLRNAQIEMERATWRLDAVLKTRCIDSHTVGHYANTVVCLESCLEIVGPRDPSNEFIIDENGVVHGHGGVAGAGRGAGVHGQKRRAKEDASPAVPSKRIKFDSARYQILSSLD